MNRAIETLTLTSNILQPETEVEQKILACPDVQEGLQWGKPRFGHPEGKVLLHVREVLNNIDVLSISAEHRARLRLVALSHDTFKFREAQYAHPRKWHNNHAHMARKFMEQYTDDAKLLTLIEYHDEAYYIWRNLFLEKFQSRGKERLEEFKAKFANNIQEYYLFFKCDTRTGDKNQAPLVWFESAIPEITTVQL